VSLAPPEALFFTGIDWAAETHAVCVADAAGTIAAGFTIEHSADGIAALVRHLARHGEAGDMPVAIERPDGRLADLLLEAGHPVVPVSPNAIKAWRDGEVLSGAKSDAGGAAVIAEYLRLRQHRLKTAAPYCDETLALRTVVRSRGDLARHGYSGRRTAAGLLARLRDAGLAAVGVLTALNASVKNPGRSVAAHLGEHPDGKIFTSLPRSGQVNAAQVLAEPDDCRQACDGPGSVAALAGCTPVTRESGKHRGVHFRWACNKRFRAAITLFAGNSRHASPWAAKTYTDARASGKDHPHAIRILACAWIRVIWPCWLNGIPCHPARHGAAAALAEQPAKQIAA